MPSPSCLAGRLLGVAVTVEGPPDLIETLRLRLPPGWLEEPVEPLQRWYGEPGADPKSVSVRRGDLSLGTWEPRAAAAALMSDLELWVAEHTADTVVVHAAVVAAGGAALVLPGRSLRGKSTLTVALLRAGARFLSDEYALLDGKGQVSAYPRAVSVRPRAGEPGGAPARITATELGAVIEPGPLPVALVAELLYDADAGWRFDALSPGRTTLALMDNAVAARTRPGPVLQACAAVARNARGIAGTRGDADDAAERLLELLPAW